MQSIIYLFLAFIPGLIYAVQNPAMTDRLEITGQWVRIGPAGPITLNFKSDGMVEGDFGNDGNIEIVSGYSMKGDHIIFKDKEGAACPEPGKYEIHLNEYYIAFDLIN